MVDLGWRIVWTAFPFFLAGYFGLMASWSYKPRARQILAGAVAAGGVSAACLVVGLLVVIWS